MYRLLIVDDEEIEREGMTNFISWAEYDIELAGTAWNGVEGYQKIQTEKPDIVITDIKMPVMNGIELIHKTRENFPEIIFIVLSGYGEYEFMSQAMREGVKYYVLKPCDEKKIIEVIEKVKEEISEKRMEKARVENVQATVRRLLPRAREQVFRNMLLAREMPSEDYRLFIEEIGYQSKQVMVLALRSEERVDYLEQIIMENILGELLGEKQLLMSAFIQNDVLFLLDTQCRDKVKAAVSRTEQEFQRVKTGIMYSAISEAGELKRVDMLYKQVQELFRIGNTEQRRELLHYEMFHEMREEAAMLVDYGRIEESEDFSDILFELYLAYLKMQMQGYQLQQMREVFGWILKILYGERVEELEDIEEFWPLYEKMTEIVAEEQGIDIKGKEQQRMKSILLALYQNIGNMDLNIRYLAREVLYMNEDYFGRVFLKNTNKKFSAYVLELRIRLAKCLLKYDPEIKISILAELTGYAPDGQYFSKAFKKVTGITPSEYKEFLLEKDRRKNETLK
ncbi:MAG: response regulator [Oliverpabstia sp.]